MLQPGHLAEPPRRVRTTSGGDTSLSSVPLSKKAGLRPLPATLGSFGSQSLARALDWASRFLALTPPLARTGDNLGSISAPLGPPYTEFVCLSSRASLPYPHCSVK